MSKRIDLPSSSASSVSDISSSSEHMFNTLTSISVTYDEYVHTSYYKTAINSSTLECAQITKSLKFTPLKRNKPFHQQMAMTM